MKSNKKQLSFLEQRKELLASLPDQIHEMVNRRTGKTLSGALSAISYAMRTRNRPIKIVAGLEGKFNEVADHTGSVAGREDLFRTIIDVISKLQLEGFVVDKKHCTIMYKLEDVNYKM